MEKSTSPFLHATMKLLTNFENASVTLLRNPKAGLWPWEHAYWKPPVILKSFSEAGYDTYTGENWPMAEYCSKDEKLDRHFDISSVRLMTQSILKVLKQERDTCGTKTGQKSIDA